MFVIVVLVFDLVVVRNSLILVVTVFVVVSKKIESDI
jgi:hypothetical protein